MIQKYRYLFPLILFLLASCDDLISLITCYDVQFELDGGSGISLQKVDEGRKVSKPLNPTKISHKFDGWYKDALFTDNFDFNQNITANTSVYAKWTAFYTVTFQSNGGSHVLSQTIANSKTTRRPPNPTKNRYAFVGWYQDEKLTKPFISNITSIQAHTKLYAKWTQNFYVVDFDQGDVPEQRVASGQTANKPTDEPTRDDYKFDKWYETTARTKPFDFNQNISADTSVYAGWTALYTVTFEINRGGSAVAGQKIPSGQTASKPEPSPTRADYWLDRTKIDYEFVGWYKNIARTKPFDFDTPITADTIIYADWMALFPVTFDDGVDVSMDTEPGIDFIYGENLPPSQTVPNGERATEPVAPPTREHFKFDKWAPSRGGGFDFSAPIMEPTTLYAKWRRNQYTVTFHIGSGDPNFKEKTRPQEQTIDSGLTAQKLVFDPRSRSYRFLGWYADWQFANPFDFEHTKITKNTTIYAKWNTTYYTLTFNSTGGSPVPNQTVSANGQAIPPQDEPQKVNYRFEQWLITWGGSAPYDFNTPIRGPKTIYASWVRQYMVTFNTDVANAPNGGLPTPAVGLPTPDPQKVDTGKTATEPASAPTRQHYQFVAWYETPARTTRFDFTQNITADTIIYAQWSKIPYTVTFDTDVANGGSLVVNQTKFFDQKASKPAAPNKSQHRFLEWYQDSQYRNVFDFTQNITADTIIYAKWTRQYTVTFNTDNPREADGGSKVLSQKVDTGKTATEPRNEPTWNHSSPPPRYYRFDQWVTASGAPYNFNTPITADTTIYAQWVPQYSVTFVSNGGSAVAHQRVDSGGAKARKPNNPVWNRHTFLEWSKDKALKNEFKFNNERITKNTTIYAKWSPEFQDIIDITSCNGFLYVVDVALEAIIRVDPTGRNTNYKSRNNYESKDLTRGLGPGLYSPRQMACYNGNLYVTEQTRNAVIKVDLNNGDRTVFSQSGVRGSGENFVGDVYGITNLQGNFYVGTEGKIVKIDMDGDRTVLSEEAIYQTPRAITDDGGGTLYIIDFTNPHLSVVSLNINNRKFNDEDNYFFAPRDITYFDQNLYIVNSGNNPTTHNSKRIILIGKNPITRNYDTNIVFSQAGIRGDGPDLDKPHGVTVLNGDLYIVDNGLMAVIKVDSDGNRTYISKNP